MSKAFKKAFISKYIISSFGKAGTWLISIDPFTRRMRPVLFDNNVTVVDRVILRAKFHTKRREAINKDDIQPLVVRRGYVDTSKGLVLTSNSEMKVEQQEK